MVDIIKYRDKYDGETFINAINFYIVKAKQENDISLDDRSQSLVLITLDV